MRVTNTDGIVTEADYFGDFHEENPTKTGEVFYMKQYA
jgi:hypothetical protein